MRTPCGVSGPALRVRAFRKPTPLNRLSPQILRVQPAVRRPSPPPPVCSPVFPRKGQALPLPAQMRLPGLDSPPLWFRPRISAQSVSASPPRIFRPVFLAFSLRFRPAFPILPPFFPKLSPPFPISFLPWQGLLTKPFPDSFPVFLPELFPPPFPPAPASIRPPENAFLRRLPSG